MSSRKDSWHESSTWLLFHRPEVRTLRLMARRPSHPEEARSMPPARWERSAIALLSMVSAFGAVGQVEPQQRHGAEVCGHHPFEWTFGFLLRGVGFRQ